MMLADTPPTIRAYKGSSINSRFTSARQQVLFWVDFTPMKLAMEAENT